MKGRRGGGSTSKMSERGEGQRLVVKGCWSGVLVVEGGSRWREITCRRGMNEKNGWRKK